MYSRTNLSWCQILIDSDICWQYGRRFGGTLDDINPIIYVDIRADVADIDTKNH